MKKRLLTLLICLVVSFTASANAGIPSGITYNDFSSRFEEALLEFGMYPEDIVFCDLYNSEDGLEVYTCMVNTGTLITTTFWHTGCLEKLEWTIPYHDRDSMLNETSAVISSFYVDGDLYARSEKAAGFMDSLAEAFAASPEDIIEKNIGDYTLTLYIGVEYITYIFSLYE